MTSSTSKGCAGRVKEALTLNCRQVLNLMVFFGFMFNYMLRVNLTIAIVEMVVPHSKGNLTVAGLNSTALNVTQPQGTLQGTRFHWDEVQQNMVLGSFFWGYLLTELPGGRLAEVVGARRVLGYSMLGASILTLLTPTAANLSFIAVVILRALIGFLLGVTWPAMLPMAARWIPPADRSKFMSNMMASSLGAALTMPLCGLLISSLGWESTFYVTGVIGLVWSVSWFLLVFDSPSQHPRISQEERRFIEHALGASVAAADKPPACPWRSLLTSGPVWAIILTHVASIYGFFTVVNQLPTYMKHILGFNIKQNGLASSLPYLGKYLMALGTGVAADWLKSRNTLSTTAIRKIFTTFAVGVPGILMVAQAFLGHDRWGSVTIFTLALTFNGAVTAGYLGNGLDIAPNFSGTIFGMANMLSSTGGYLSTFMVGSLTYQNQSYGQWQIIFWILAGVYLLGAVVYLVLGTGELQPWNTPGTPGTRLEKDKEQQERESIPLQP